MAYSTINKSTANMSVKLYSGNGASSQAITGVGHQPDLVWIKRRNSGTDHQIHDSVRGKSGSNYQYIQSNNTNSQSVQGDNDGISAFGTDGFTAGYTNSAAWNESGGTWVSWNWKAGGPTPTKTYKVVVVSDSGNKYRFRNSADTATFAQSAVTLNLQEGGTYTFDVSDSTLNSHPFVIGTAANSSEYSTGVTYKLDGVTKTYSQYTSGFSAATSRQLIITVAASAPALYYWCSSHSGMGGAINTNTTYGSTNFDGSILSVVSNNATAGFSIVSYTGTGSAGPTIGHGLGGTPDLIIQKNLNAGVNWSVYHTESFTSQAAPGVLYLNTTADKANDVNVWGNSSVTINSSVFSVGDYQGTNGNTDNMIAYCYKAVDGYSSFGKYTGNGNATYGPFVNLGFRPSLVIVKNNSQDDSWFMNDDKRDGFNDDNEYLFSDLSNAEGSNVNRINFYSNGFQTMTADKSHNVNGNEYVYMAWGQPIVAGTNIPNNAR